MKVLDELYARHPDARDIKMAIETGTLHGETTRELAEVFSAVHTIELADELCRAAVADFARENGYGCITCHYGDSALVLPELLKGKEFQTPIVFYLDAHWFNRKGVANDAPFPLIREIEEIATRSYADVVIVDDCQHLGVGWIETETAAGKCMDTLWRSASPGWITSTLGRVRDVFTAGGRTQHMVFVQEAAAGASVPNSGELCDGK